MNQLDIFLGGAVLLFTLAGLFGGAVKRVVQVAAVVIAFRESWRLTPWVQSALEGLLGHPVGAWGFIIPLLGFLIVYLGIRMLGGVVLLPNEGDTAGDPRPHTRPCTRSTRGDLPDGLRLSPLRGDLPYASTQALER